MNDDALLLRRYAEEGTEAAFTELVHRQLGLVYGAALRRTGGDAAAAADVAQQVFTRLARDARRLADHPVLSAWLHTATRNAALTHMISEQRRRAREAAALDLAAAPDAAPEWERVRPLLDAAIDELGETDRAAIVLRFLERRPYAEIGAALRVSEDAARVRTDRALEKLHGILGRRGITSTAAALGLVVSSQPLLSAPAGLAATMAAEILAAAGPGAVAGAFASFMTAKIITTAALSALVAFGAGTYFGQTRDPVAPPVRPAAVDDAPLLTSARAENDRLAAELSRQKAEVARLTEANAGLAARVATRLTAKSPNLGGTLYELQGAILNNLRQIDAARKQFEADKGQPAASVHDLVGVGRYIKTVRTVGGEEYSGLSMVQGSLLTVTTPDGVSVTFDPTGALTTKPEIPPEVRRVEELGKKVQPSAQKAWGAYLAAHDGNPPPSEEALLPYFATPQEGADYVEFMEARKAAGR